MKEATLYQRQISPLKRLLTEWKLTLLVLIFVPLLLQLGYWQLGRADEKQALLAAYQQQQALAAIPLSHIHTSLKQSAATTTPVSYQKVRVTGVYDSERYWLLDSRSRQGQVGYEVVMPLLMASGTVLVNRGWVPAPLDRQHLPAITTPSAELTLQGYLAAPQANPMVKHGHSDWSAPWPKRVLQLDLQQAAEDLNTALHPQLLKIDADQASALRTEWTVVNLLPEKHRAYALQWFAMALALLLLYTYSLFGRQ